MKAITAPARVLVATTNGDDARQISRQLDKSFDFVQASTQPENAVADFDAFKPDVLILAFESIQLAQQYYLGLYRLGSTVQDQPHRTVVLCGKAELTAAFELCKQAHFDDYVLYWPQAYDGLRLEMSVWTAWRDINVQRRKPVNPAVLHEHVRHLGTLEHLLEEQVAVSEQELAGALRVAAQSEADITGTIEGFRQSQALLMASQGGAAAGTDFWTQELESLKRRLLDHARRVGSAHVQETGGWHQAYRAQLDAVAEGTRTLAEVVRHSRPVVMVVDDDPMVHALVRNVLAASRYDIVDAVDGAAALSHLRRMRPDVLLVDLRMPNVDGVALTRRLKAAPTLHDIPVVIMTGDARRETLVESMHAGAQAFVVKPFRGEALIAKLDQVLGGAKKASDPAPGTRAAADHPVH